MTPHDLLSTFSDYANELAAILSRFKKTSQGLWIEQSDHGRFKEICLELIDLTRDQMIDGNRHAVMVAERFNDSLKNYTESPSFRGVENVLGIVNSLVKRIERSPGCVKSTHLSTALGSSIEKLEVVFTLGERFNRVVRQLRSRHMDRPTLDVSDEYDVQDLFHALLRIDFDDVRPEEWSPSYAGGASRMDFLLPEIETVVETKMIRPSLTARKLGEELIIDIAKYAKHPQCRTLFCFVYDPDGRISNPQGIENDLNGTSDQLTVRVKIAQ